MKNQAAPAQFLFLYFKAIPGGLEIKELHGAIPKTRREPKPIPRLYYKEDKNLKKNNRGFTLAELLIVVAIIAVLVAIAIPVFTSQLEKSREATDAANIRSAYAAVQASALLQDNSTDFAKNNTADATFTVEGSEGSYIYKATVKLKQQQDQWQSGAQDIGGVSLAADTAKANGTATISHTQSTGKTEISIA